jgi:AcrR family transcriptional regulator
MAVRTQTRSTAEERRQQVLDAAVREFAASGFHGATTDAIARRAGISQAYVFRLFGSKKQLFLAAVELGTDRIEEGFRTAARGSIARDPGSLLDAMGEAYRGYLEDRELLLVQMHSYAASSDPDIRAAVRTRFEELWALVARLSGAGPEALQQFFSCGMLMNVAATIDMPLICSQGGWMPAGLRPAAGS